VPLVVSTATSLIVPLDVARRLASPLLRRPLLLPTVHRVTARVAACLLDVPPGVAAGLPRGPRIVAIRTPILTSFHACRLRVNGPRSDEQSGCEESKSKGAHTKSRPFHVILPSSDVQRLAAQGRLAALRDRDAADFQRLACLTSIEAQTRAIGNEPDGSGFDCLTGGGAAASSASQEAVAGRTYKSTPHACQGSMGL
jgi:hypothetical protein